MAPGRAHRCARHGLRAVATHGSVVAAANATGFTPSAVSQQVKRLERQTGVPLAAHAMPDGEAYYQAMIEKFTTLNLTAKEIHQIGLKEVARIEAEMQAAPDRLQCAINTSLAQIGIVAREDGPRLRALLRPGQRLVSRQNGLNDSQQVH